MKPIVTLLTVLPPAPVRFQGLEKKTGNFPSLGKFRVPFFQGLEKLMHEFPNLGNGRRAAGTTMKYFALLAALLLASLAALQAAEPSLVPDTPSTVPDYFCTWGAQGYLSGWTDTTAQSDAMAEKQVFGSGPDQGYAGLYPEIRQDLYLVLDDTWDIPLGGNRGHPGRGCFELDTGRFPSFTGTPAERLAKLNAAVRARGWRALGLWVFSGRPRNSQNPPVGNEEFWTERLAWSRDAGLAYWKVDWGSLNTFERWRLNQWANRVAPGIWVENGKLDRTGGRIWQTDKIDIHRIYDLNDATAVPESIKRVAQAIRFPPVAHSARGLINAEDEVYVGAALGCTYGVMRYAIFRNGTPDPYERQHSPGFHDLRRCTDEAVRAVRWHRIAHPFTATDHELVDEATLPFEPLSAEKKAGAPARIARGGLPLPTVTAPQGKPVPYVLCSRFPDGEIAVATIGRSLGDPAPSGRFKGMRALVVPPADVTLEAGRLDRPVGVFGEYASLTLTTSADLIGKRILAQDLAGTVPVDITAEVSVTKGRLTIPGAVIHRVGTMAGKPGELSDPGLVLAIPGLTVFVPKPAMTPARAPEREKPHAPADAGLAITRAVWGPVYGGIDVTAKLKALIRDGTLDIKVGVPILGTDGGSDTYRRLDLQYTCRGKVVEVLVLDGERLAIDTQGVNQVGKGAGPAKKDMASTIYQERNGTRSLRLARSGDEARIVIADAAGKVLVNLNGTASIVTESECAVTGRNEIGGAEERLEVMTLDHGGIQVKRSGGTAAETIIFQRKP